MKAKGAHQRFWFISQTNSAKIAESFAKEWERRRSRWTMGLSRHHVLENAAVNSFVEKYSDRMETTNWPRVFSAIARRVHPLLKDVLAGMEYYWVMDQAEYATDVMFRDAEALKAPYEQLLKHATLCFSAEDVLTFLGRKMHGRFEVKFSQT